MQITKQSIKHIAIGLYVVVSLSYIGLVQWTNFKIQYSERAFQSGQADAIAQLINQAENSECQPFSVYNQQTNVELINMTCVQANLTEQTDGSTETKSN